MTERPNLLESASPRDLTRNSVTLLLFCLGSLTALLGFSRPGLPWGMAIACMALAALLCLFVAGTANRRDLPPNQRKARAASLMYAAITLVLIGVICVLWSVAWWV